MVGGSGSVEKDGKEGAVAGGADIMAGTLNVNGILGLVAFRFFKEKKAILLSDTIFCACKNAHHWLKSHCIVISSYLSWRKMN